MRKRQAKKNKKKLFPPHKPDVVDGGLKTTESAIDQMIDEGLASGNTDPHVNGAVDSVPTKDRDKENK